MSDAFVDKYSIRVNDEIMLRPLEVGDARYLLGSYFHNHDHLGKFLPWLTDLELVSDAEDYIREKQIDQVIGEAFNFGVYSFDKLIGEVGLHYLKSRPEIGCWLDKGHSGQGKGLAVARAVTNFALNDLNFDSVTITAAVENVPSNKIAKKLGYKMVGGEKCKFSYQLVNVWQRSHIRA